MNLDSMIKGLSEISYTPITRFKKETDGNWKKLSSQLDLPFYNTLMENVPRIKNVKHNRHTHILVHEEIMLYGMVEINEGNVLVIGPLIRIPIDNSIAQSLLKSLNIPVGYADQFIDYYQSTPHYSIYRFAQIMTFLNNSLFEEEPISIGEILPEEYRRSITEENDNSRKISSAEEYMTKCVKSQDYELELYSYVYGGNYQKMKSFISQTHYDGDNGQLSHSVMQQNKYLVITSIALASRAAVQGGLNYNTAMQQADHYYRRVDVATTFNELFDIHKQMLLTYTKLVADKKLGIPTPPLFLPKVQSYIETHITEKITTDDIAKALNMNRSYLSTQFKKECGFDLNRYICRLKIDEAKRLLRASNLSLIEISTTLAFATPSHFAAVFKKMENMTPTEFIKSQSLMK